MLKESSNYKGMDLLTENNMDIIKNVFNPYEYNLEGNTKDKISRDILSKTSKCHIKKIGNKK